MEGKRVTTFEITLNNEEILSVITALYDHPSRDYSTLADKMADLMESDSE